VSIRPIAKFLYGLVAAVFLIGGVTVLLLRTGLLPAAVRNIVMNVAHDPLRIIRSSWLASRQFGKAIECRREKAEESRPSSRTPNTLA